MNISTSTSLCFLTINLMRLNNGLNKLLNNEHTTVIIVTIIIIISIPISNIIVHVYSPAHLINRPPLASRAQACQPLYFENTTKNTKKYISLILFRILLALIAVLMVLFGEFCWC